MKPIARDNIFLTGFMGAGKTTVGRLLAPALNRDFIDLDRWVEKNEGKSVAAIFQERQEEGFRTLESLAIESLSGKPGLVVALGGGSLTRDESRKRVFSSGTVIYLEATLDAVRARIASDSTQRPLAASDLASLLEARRTHYEQAPIRIDTNFKTPEKVVAAILAQLNQESR